MYDVCMYVMDKRLASVKGFTGRHARHTASRILIRDILSHHKGTERDVHLLSIYLITVATDGHVNLDKETTRVLHRLSDRGRVRLYRTLNRGIRQAGSTRVPTHNKDKTLKSPTELKFQAAVNAAVVEILTDLKRRLREYDWTITWRSRLPISVFTIPAPH